jgi:hypothetical protein
MAEDKSAKTVTIACKHPPGLVLRLFKTRMVTVPVLGGGNREEPRAEPIPGREATINGPAKPIGEEPRCLVVGGFAITSGVDRELWEEWKKQNADSDLLKNRLLFAFPTPEAAQAEAKNSAKVRSGLEPLDMSMKSVPGPDGTPRMVARDDRVPRAPGLSIQKEGTAA